MDTVTQEILPTIANHLAGRYQRLTPEQQRRIQRAYERHRRACERLGCPVDPDWMCAAITEASRNEL